MSAIEHRFMYHAPDEQDVVDHTRVRSQLRDVALDFDRFLPEGREKSLALTKLEEAVFWANAAIARG